MRKRTGTLGTLAFVTFMGGGCAYFTPTPTLMPATGEAVVNRDLPVPEEFVLIQDETFRHERSAYRRLRLTYRRPDYLSQERVLEFVKQAYPGAGWKTEFVHGLEVAEVIFTKATEECRVTVQEDSDGFTQMVVEVEPRQTPSGGLVARSTWDARTDVPVAEPPPASVAATSSASGTEAGQNPATAEAAEPGQSK
jgi:hypothetical protein